MRIFYFVLFLIFLSCKLIAQPKVHTLPINEDDIKGGNISAYFHPTSNSIVVNTQKQDTLVHRFYDSAFNLIDEYKVNGERRKLVRTGLEKDAIARLFTKKSYFVEHLSIQNSVIEIYLSRDSVFIYELDPVTKADVPVTGIELKNKYRDELLLATMPNDKGCNFLSVSLKKEMIILYKWLKGQQDITAIEVPFLESTLSKEEMKTWGGNYLELKNKQLFAFSTVARAEKPETFQFPFLGQLFYNDSCIFIVNPMPEKMGTNIVAINSNTGIINSRNYIVNKLPSHTNLNDISSPAATIYDSLLIIQNWSERKFEYYFYNLNKGDLIRKYQVKNDDSIYSFVHSPLRQFGTFGAAAQEKQTGNERRFARKMEHGIRFLKPMVSGDSLVLTVGSIIPTIGIEGLLLGVTTLAASAAAGLTYFYYYMDRNRFLFAHSKFSLKTLEPANESNVRTFLDEFITNKQMDELKSDNSILIAKPGKLYIGIYSKKSHKLTFTEFDSTN